MVRGANTLDRALIFAGNVIGRIHRQRESQVRRRVLVTAEHAGVRRQVSQPIQRSIHLSRRTLEHSAAARTEKRISAKQRAMTPKRNVAYRMPGLVNLEEIPSPSTQRSPSLRERAANSGIVGADHGYFPMAQQLRNPAHMIRMMVSE